MRNGEADEENGVADEKNGQADEKNGDADEENHEKTRKTDASMSPLAKASAAV